MTEAESAIHLMYKNILDTVAYMRRLQKEQAKKPTEQNYTELRKIETAVDFRLRELGL